MSEFKIPPEKLTEALRDDLIEATRKIATPYLDPSTQWQVEVYAAVLIKHGIVRPIDQSEREQRNDTN